MKKQHVESSQRYTDYNRKNPVFSLRLSSQLKDIVENLERESELNRRDLFQRLYTEQKADFDAAIEKKVNQRLEKACQDAFEQGRTAGLKQGAAKDAENIYNNAVEQTKKKFAIPIHCSICGMPLYIPARSEMHGHILELLEREGWCHGHCISLKKLYERRPQEEKTSNPFPSL